MTPPLPNGIAGYYAAALAVGFASVSLVMGCGSHLVPEPESEPNLPPSDDPAVCDVPDRCSGRVTMMGCVGLKYQYHDICYFTELLGDEPTVIRAVNVNFCGDSPYVARYLDIYRFADGSMACAFGEAELEYVQTDVDPTMPSEVDTYDCWFSDLSMFETCLVDAIAGVPSTPTTFFQCLDWWWWSIEIGDPVEPVCR